MAAERKRGIRMTEETIDFPPPAALFTCGSPGVWAFSAFQGGLGCLGRFASPQYDFHARMCFSCSRSLCAEFEAPQGSSGPLEAAVRLLARYTAFVPGFEQVGRHEAVRMLVLASRGTLNNPTARESAGAARIVARFPSMMGCWPEGDRRALEKIGEMPYDEKPTAPNRRIPPELEGFVL